MLLGRRQLGLAVARRLQLGQCLETLLHRLIINTFRRARRIQLVEADRLFLDRKCLLLQQRAAAITRELAFARRQRDARLLREKLQLPDKSICQRTFYVTWGNSIE